MGRTTLADFGGLLDDLKAGDLGSYYKRATITWSEPARIRYGEPVPLSEDRYLKKGYLYILSRNHGNQSVPDQILYVGITNNLNRRFYNHPKFKNLVKSHKHVFFHVGQPNFHGYRTAENSHNRAAIEELEHIYIWTLYEHLHNHQKVWTVPGMKRQDARPWLITNDGYGFSGNMPKRIAFPWAAVTN